MDNPLIRNDFVNFIYGIMLLEFMPKKLSVFFESINERFPGTIGFASHIADPRKKLKHSDIMFFYSAFYDFCLTHNKEPGNLFEKHLIRGNGFATRAETMLHVLEPILPQLIGHSFDAREVLLKKIKLITERLRPETIQRLVKFVQNDDESFGIQAYNLPDGRIYEHPHVDGSSFMLIMNKLAPLRFNAPPYDRGWMIAECQTVAERLSSMDDVSFVDDILYIKGERYGYKTSFVEYLESNDYDLCQFDFPITDCSVVFIEKEYRRPTRNQILLNKDCLYGASCYMYGLAFDHKQLTDKHSLELIISELYEKTGGDYNWKNVEELHSEFLTYLDECEKDVYEVVLHRKSEVVFGNGAKIIRGDGALILFYLLKNYNNHKKNTFTNKELIESKYFNSLVSNSQFRTALVRLVKRLEKTQTPLQITLSGRGSFYLSCDIPIKITELEA